MTEVRQLKLEPLTREAFAPFGDVPEMSGRPPDFEGVGTHAWILDYAEGGTAELLAVNSWYQGFPSRGSSATSTSRRRLLPSDRRRPESPSPRQPIRATRNPSPLPTRCEPSSSRSRWATSCGAGRGTHSTGSPLYPSEANFVMVTTAETTHELKTVELANWRLTQDVDYTERLGITFELVL